MVKQYQLFLLPILVAASVFATTALKPWNSSMKSEDKILAPTVKKSKPPKRGSGLRKVKIHYDDSLNGSDSKKMWTKNLFNPEREESESIARNGVTVISENDTLYDFELLGITVIGDKAFANMSAKRKSSSSRYSSSSRSIRYSSSRRIYKPKISTTTKKKPSRPNKNYRLEEEIKENGTTTGFKLKSIGLDHVVLKRREQELTVELNRGGAGGKARRLAETKIQLDEAKKKAPIKIVKVSHKKKKLIPPPPPPMPNPGQKMPSRGGSRGKTVK